MAEGGSEKNLNKFSVTVSGMNGDSFLKEKRRENLYSGLRYRGKYATLNIACIFM